MHNRNVPFVSVEMWKNDTNCQEACDTRWKASEILISFALNRASLGQHTERINELETTTCAEFDAVRCDSVPSR